MSIPIFRANRYIQLQDHGNTTPTSINLTTAFSISAHAFQNGNTFEPPSPRVTDLHAACVKITHASGARERSKEAFKDTVVVPIMTAPNAADELVHALTKVQIQQPPISKYV